MTQQNPQKEAWAEWWKADKQWPSEMTAKDMIMASFDAGWRRGVAHVTGPPLDHWINIRFDEMRAMFGAENEYPYPMAQRIYWLLMVKVVREIEEMGG